MSIEASIDLLQAINATVAGVTSAPVFASYPIGEISGNAPNLMLTYPGPGEWSREGSEYQVSRRYDIVFYAMRRYQEDAVTGKQMAAPVLDALGKAYLAEATYLAGLPYVLSCGPPKVRVDISLPITDENESDEWTPEFAGVFYHGFRYSLTVIEEGTL